MEIASWYFSPRPLQTDPVCRPTRGSPKSLQTNLCRGLVKDTTCSALTGLDNWLPEPRAQRAREPPFVREAAPLPSGLSLRMPACTPKGGSRALDLLPKHEKMCLDKSASRFGVLALPAPCSWGEGGAGRHEQPEGNGATRADTTKMHRHSRFLYAAALRHRRCSRKRASRTNRALARAFCTPPVYPPFPSSKPHTPQSPIRCLE